MRRARDKIVPIDAAITAVQRVGVSRAVEWIAQACLELAKRAEASPNKGIGHERAASYRYAARTLNRCAERIRHQANAVGF